jgi:hypothetical protein
LRGVHETEEFADFEVVRDLADEFFKRGSGVGVAAGFVSGDGGLEEAVVVGRRRIGLSAKGLRRECECG